MTEFEREFAISRNDVERGAALDRADVNGRERHVIVVIVPLVMSKPERHRADVGDDLARDLDRIDAVRSQCGVRFETAHRASIRPLALVRDDELHACRLTDDATSWLIRNVGQVRDQPPHADASDLLVVRQREVQGLRERAPGHLRHQCERDADEALHVADTPADDGVAGSRDLPRIGRPRLAIDGHDVSVSGDDDSAIDLRADRGEEVRFLA